MFVTTQDTLTTSDSLAIPSNLCLFRLVYKGGHLYLFGGVVESGEKDITLKDFYSLDTSKFDSWNVIIENDSMEWLGNEEGEDDEDVSDEDESDMDTD